jgi:hypothetical protein
VRRFLVIRLGFEIGNHPVAEPDTLLRLTDSLPRRLRCAELSVS